MADLEKLKNIDWKNVDLNKIVQLLTDKKSSLAKAAVAVIFIGILIVLVHDYRVQGKDLREQLGKLEEKIDAVEMYGNGRKKMQAFLEALPKPLDEDQLSSQITDYAAQNNVLVLSFSPGQKRAENLVEIITARMSVRVERYQDFLMFLKTIENSPFNLRIDSCFISMGAAKTAMMNQQSNAIEAQMEISSVNIKK